MRRRFDYILFVATFVELMLIVTLLAIFASTFVSRSRTKLWHEGGRKGWNSDPVSRIYLYANYQEIPPIPLIWDESLSQCNLCISVATLFVWIARFTVQEHAIGIGMSIAINAFYDLLLSALWSYSATMQNSADFSDAEHMSPRPWYLERGVVLAIGVSCIMVWFAALGNMYVWRVFVGSKEESQRNNGIDV